jgi:hypothetical protein
MVRKILSLSSGRHGAKPGSDHRARDAPSVVLNSFLRVQEKALRTKAQLVTLESGQGLVELGEV